MLNKLFVYGSLRKGKYNHHYLENKAENLGTFYVKGKLYSIKNKKYPALIEDDSEFTIGELYNLLVNFCELDEMEGYKKEDIENSEYIRKIVDVYDKNKNIFDKAYIYFYNPKLKSNLFCKIEENDFDNYK